VSLTARFEYFQRITGAICSFALSPGTGSDCVRCFMQHDGLNLHDRLGTIGPKKTKSSMACKVSLPLRVRSDRRALYRSDLPEKSPGPTWGPAVSKEMCFRRKTLSALYGKRHAAVRFSGSSRCPHEENTETLFHSNVETFKGDLIKTDFFG